MVQITSVGIIISIHAPVKGATEWLNVEVIE